MQYLQRVVTGGLSLWFLAAPAAEASDPYFQTRHFSGSGNCASCHNRLYDQLGEDVSIEDEWSATMMANASRDPLWQAKFASEILRNTQIESLLNDKCTRCHAPMANEEAKASGDELQFFDDGFSDATNLYHDAAMDGVSCTLCHQIADDPDLGPPLGSPESFSGNFTIQDFDDPPNRPAYGPFADSRVNPMQRESGFKPQLAAHISDSALCATCHNLVTPVLNTDDDSVMDIEFPEQMVYTEWQNSAYRDGGDLEQSCQSCHMARADGVKIANRPPNLPARDDFRRHGFYGGNLLMLDILDANRDVLGVGDGDFSASVDATRRTLRSAAELGIDEAVIDGEANELRVRVRVTNKTGHKLPTSFPSRRLFIHFVVSDERGDILFESGRPNEDGSVVGVDGDSGAVGYEPHYDEITGAEQVQVYEPIMGDSNANQTYTLLRAAGYLKDNRILPRGSLRGSLPEEIAVQGAAADDPNFGDGSDLVTYRVSLSRPVDTVTVSANLNYQTLSQGFVRDLRTDYAGHPAIKRFLDMYDESQVRVETIAEVSAMVGPVSGDR